MIDRGRQNQGMFAGACLLALATIVGAYSNSFQNSFHFDDSHVIEQNLYIRSIGNIPSFFRDATTFSALPANATYRPLVSTTLAIDYWLGGGLNVRQFHISQLAMLVALGVMLYFFMLRIFDQGHEKWWNRYVALLAALLFSVHTANTETMNAIAARSELLSTMGIVGSFLVYFFLPGTRGVYLYLIPMVVGALAKTPAVIFAPLFLVYVMLFEQHLSFGNLLLSRSWYAIGEMVRKALPAFVVAAVMFVAVESQNAPAATYGGGDRLHYVLTQLFVWFHYARLFFLPVGLTADTDWTLVAHWYDTRVIGGALFIALLVRLLWVTSRTEETRPVAFGIAWFALGLLPASSIFPLAEVANEHRVFLPFIGMSLAVVWAIALAFERAHQMRPARREVIVAAACALSLVTIGGHGVGAHERNKTWKSDEALWRDVTEKSPGNGRGWMNYGLSQMSQGKFAEAKRLFERAQVSTPNYASLEINLGVVASRLGEHVVAEQHFRRALQLQPDYPASHTFFARWLVERGRVPEAISHLQRAIAESPADTAARYQLLDAYAAAGRLSELKSLAEQTLSLVPGDAKARKYLNDRGEAVVSTLPTPIPGADAADALDASLRLYQAGDFQGSIDAARRAITLQPASAEAYNNIAAASASLRKWDDAVHAAQEALRLKPDFPLARNNLAWAQKEQKKVDGRP